MLKTLSAVHDVRLLLYMTLCSAMSMPGVNVVARSYLQFMYLVHILTRNINTGPPYQTDSVAGGRGSVSVDI